MIKKFTIMAILTLIATFTFAQPQSRGQQVSHLLTDVLVQKSLTNGLSTLFQSPNTHLTKAPRKAASDYPVIEQTPAGREVTYAPKAGKYFYIGIDNKIYQTDITQNMTVVFGENNKVWLKDPLSMGIVSWLEGTVSADGRSISFPVGQNLLYAANYDVAYQAYMMELNADQNDYVKSESGSIVYALTPNGLKMKDTDAGHIVGVALKTTNPANIQFDNSWSGYGAYGAEYELTSTPSKELVVVPEGVESQIWTLNGETYTYDGNNYPNGRTTRQERKVKVAIDGNDFYIQGFCSYTPNGWVKGIREGNNVTFHSPQFLGNVYGRYDMFFVGSTDDGYQTEKDVVFTYDEEAKELKTTDAIWIKYDAAYIDVFFNTTLKLSDEVEINTEVVTIQPAGELKIYARTGYGYSYNMDYGAFQTSQDGMIAEVVYDADGSTVWFKDPISTYNTHSWVKGTREGNTIKVPLNQCVEYYESESYGYTLAFLKKVSTDEYDEGSFYYVKDSDITEATFTIDDATGTITLNGTDNDSENYPDHFFGLVYVDILPNYNDQWAGYGDWATVYSPVTYQPVSVPDNLQTEEWNFTYTNYEGSRNGKIVKVGINDNDLYIQGISELLPEAWVKGTINGNQVTFEQNQYQGIAVDYFIFIKGAKVEQLYNDFYEEYYKNLTELNGPLTMTYDAAAKTLSGEDSFIENVGNGEIIYNTIYSQPFLSVYVEKSAKPTTPQITDYYDGMDEYGFNAVYFTVPNLDVNGQVIKTENLAFQFYTDIDGEVDNYTFYADEYQLDEDRVIIKYDEKIYEVAGQYVDISAAYGEAFIYQTGFDKLGIQSINYTAGSEERSEIAWYTVNDYNGVKTISDAETVSTRYTDLMGRTVSPSAKGLLIKTARLSDGTVKATKVLRR